MQQNVLAPEKVSMNAGVGIRARGQISFGQTKWIQRNVIRLESSGDLTSGEPCELKLELKGQNGWLLAEAVVIRATDWSQEKMTQADVRILRMSETDRSKLKSWVRTRGEAGGRQRTPRAQAQAKTQATASNVTHLRQPEPVTTMASNGREVCLTWRDLDKAREDWCQHLILGRAVVRGKPPASDRITLSLSLPNGWEVSLPGVISARRSNRWVVRFRLDNAMRSAVTRSLGLRPQDVLGAAK